LAVDRQHVARNLLIGVPLALALIPALAINQVLQTPFYPGQLPPQIALVQLSPWATAYSVVVWPTLWRSRSRQCISGTCSPEWS
jgi:hypothetical protein